jgi:hypothetical protein
VDGITVGSLVFGAAIVLVQALDLLGHWLNHRKLQEAHRRLDEADKRGELVRANLNEIASKFNELVTALQAPKAEFAHGQVDPREARAARAEKDDLRTLTAADLKAKLGPLAVELWQQFFPDEWKAALQRPHLVEEIWRRIGPAITARLPNVDGAQPQTSMYDPRFHG